MFLLFKDIFLLIFSYNNNNNKLQYSKKFFPVYFHKNIKIDKYNLLYLSLQGLMIWLNLLHINIIIIKFSFLIILNNFEYLILFLF